MTALEIILFLTTLLASIFGIRNGVKLRRMREKNRDYASRVIELTGELSRKRIELETVRHSIAIWQTSAHDCALEVERMKLKTATLSKTSTDLSVTVDALMNGDLVCPNGHKYYDGPRCPHCGVETPQEIVEHGIQ